MLDIYARAVNVCSYHSQSTTFGSEATYTCLVGFRFNVSDADDIERAIECDARGNWTTDTATKCERKNGFVVHINDVCLAVRMVLQCCSNSSLFATEPFRNGLQPRVILCFHPFRVLGFHFRVAF